MRISDWSSDVCSSDLQRPKRAARPTGGCPFWLGVSSGTWLVRSDRRAPAAPDIDDDEEEQPHDVNEVPVPGRRLEAEMLLRREMALVGAHQADDQDRKSTRLNSSH